MYTYLNTLALWFFSVLVSLKNVDFLFWTFSPTRLVMKPPYYKTVYMVPKLSPDSANHQNLLFKNHCRKLIETKIYFPGNIVIYKLHLHVNYISICLHCCYFMHISPVQTKTGYSCKKHFNTKFQGPQIQ